MGKSNKKTKSDRINALRKQYDSFMEEDKKRKHRNDFILETLDKMRLCNAMVPVQCSANPHVKKDCALQEQPENRQKRTLFERRALLVSKQKTDLLMDCAKLDEELILKEIIKKYILIPKLPSTRDNMAIYYNSSSINDDTDWKNKYNILDDLKKIETEESPQIKAGICENFSANNDSNLPSGDQEMIKGTSYQPQKINNKDISENKDIYHIDTKVPIENKNDSDFNFTNPKINEQANSCGINIKVEGGMECKNSNKLNHSYFQDKTNIRKILPTDMAQINEDQISGIVITEGIFENKKFELSNKNEKEEEKKNEMIARTEDINQSSELIPSDDSDQCEPLPENSRQQEEEEDFENNENVIVSENVIISQIDDFEAEQKEMFYSEESEYKNNSGKLEYNTQNEQYANEHYSYYDESQQDQPYHAEINEHEESTERYDPNYEQQYVSNYEENANVVVYGNYDNQQEATNVNYNEHVGNLEYVNSENTENTEHTDAENMNVSVANENVSYNVEQFNNNELLDDENTVTAPDEQNIYQIQPEYMETHYECETMHNLENKLDREDGYVEIENTDISNSNIFGSEKENSNISGSEIENLLEVSSEIKKSDVTLVPE